MRRVHSYASPTALAYHIGVPMTTSDSSMYKSIRVNLAHKDSLQNKATPNKTNVGTGNARV